MPSLHTSPPNPLSLPPHSTDAGQRELDDAALDPTSEAYASALELITAQKHAHLSAMTGPNAAGKNQMGMGDYYELAPCADPESQLKYPGLPNCTITPGAWQPFGASVSAEGEIAVRA